MMTICHRRGVFFTIFMLMSLIFTSSPNYTSFPDVLQADSVVVANSSLEFNSTNAYNHISSQLDFGYRVPGTVDHDTCAEWIGNQLSLSVDEVIKHNFTIQKENQPSYDCQNILGKLNTAKKNIVILASHWDSRNVAEKDYINQSLPIPGANDGASGVGVLLELAQVMNIYKESLDCELWFLFLDAEDQGYSREMYGLEGWNWSEGSKAFTQDISDFYNSNENIECFILLDMVGGFDLQFVKENRSDKDLHNAIFSLGNELGYEVAFPNNPKEMSITDDHVYFDEIGIPVIDLIIDFVAGNWTYHHTHSDNLANIAEESLEITGKTLEYFIKKYYTIGDNLKWNGSLFSNNLTIIIVSVVVVLGVFILNLYTKGRKKRI